MLNNPVYLQRKADGRFYPQRKNYLLKEEDYKREPCNSDEERRQNIYQRIDLINELWHPIMPNLRLSGSCAISLMTGKCEKTPKDTDISLIKNEAILNFMIKAAAQRYWFLMERRSLKLWPTSDVKYHSYFPKRLEDMLNSEEKNQNLEFVKIDEYSHLIKPKFPIKIYFHKREGGLIISQEDGLILPEEYFNGNQARSQTGKSVQLIGINYLKARKQQMRKNKESRHLERHMEHLKQLERLQ